MTQDKRATAGTVLPFRPDPGQAKPPRRPQGDRAPEDCLIGLARTAIARIAEHGPRPPVAPNAAAFARAALSPDLSAAEALLRRALQAGVPVEELCTVHLAGAARLLGTYWEQDRVGSAQVTIATARLGALLRELHDGAAEIGPREVGRAVFAGVPGEQHTLGLLLATDLFRRAGWTIDLILGRDHAALVADIARATPPILCLAAASRQALSPLLRLTDALQVQVPETRIVICGQLAGRQPSLAKLTGVALASDDFDTIRGTMEVWAQALPPQAAARR